MLQKIPRFGVGVAVGHGLVGVPDVAAVLGEEQGRIGEFGAQVVADDGAADAADVVVALVRCLPLDRIDEAVVHRELASVGHVARLVGPAMDEGHRPLELVGVDGHLALGGKLAGDDGQDGGVLHRPVAVLVEGGPVGSWPKPPS